MVLYESGEQSSALYVVSMVLQACARVAVGEWAAHVRAHKLPVEYCRLQPVAEMA